MTRDAFGRRPAPLLPEPEPVPEPLPIPTDVPPGHLDLLLWVHVDQAGAASYGGRLPVPEVVSTLRFLADHIEGAAARASAS